MKKPKPQPGQEQNAQSRQEQKPDEGVSEQETAVGYTPAGLKWLKYTGIGPARQRQGKEEKEAGNVDKERKPIAGKNLSELAPFSFTVR